MKPILTSLFIVFYTFLLSGCVISFSGENLVHLDPITPKVSPRIESSIGKVDEFSYIYNNREGAEARLFWGGFINTQILDAWKKNKYISSHSHVKRGKSTGTANYNLTLKGVYETNQNMFLTFLQVCSIGIIPVFDYTSYELIFELENTQTGQKYTSKVDESLEKVTSILLLPAVPFLSSGRNEVINNLAETAYQDFVNQGAFQ